MYVISLSPSLLPHASRARWHRKSFQMFWNSCITSWEITETHETKEKQSPRIKKLPELVIFPPTPNLPTKIIPTKICRLIISGKVPMDMRIPPLKLQITLGSNPLKSTINLSTEIGRSSCVRDGRAHSALTGLQMESRNMRAESVRTWIRVSLSLYLSNKRCNMLTQTGMHLTIGPHTPEQTHFWVSLLRVSLVNPPHTYSQTSPTEKRGYDWTLIDCGHFRTKDLCAQDSRVSVSREEISKSHLRPPGTTYWFKICPDSGLNIPEYCVWKWP